MQWSVQTETNVGLLLVTQALKAVRGEDTVYLVERH